MRIIFCEECGGKNKVEPAMLAKVDKEPIVCQICGNSMSEETIIPHGRSANTVDTSHYHLLFIDDDLFHLQLMKTSMEKEYRVSIASTGKQGLELAEELLPDLILLDVDMPGMNGHEICVRLKENDKTRQIPVIFVSALTKSDDEREGFALGAVDYINKPINLEILHARIAVQLRLKLLLEQHAKQADSLAQSLQESSLQAESEQERLVQERNSFLSILNSLEERVTIEDTEKRIVWANKATLEATDMDLSEVMGRHCHEILLHSSSVCGKCPLAAGQGSGLTAPVEMDSPNQGPGLVQSHIPLFDDEGELRGIAHIVREKRAGGADSGQAAEVPEDGYLAANRAGVVGSLSEILFGVDAMNSMYRDDKQFTVVNRAVSKAAERLDRLIQEMLQS